MYISNEIKNRNKVLAGYIGCKGWLKDNEHGDICKLTSVGDFIHLEYQDNWRGSGEFSEFKLALTPLSDISDEDAIEVGKMCGLAKCFIDILYSDQMIIKDDSYTLEINFGGYIRLLKNGQLYNMNMLPIYQYLQSKFYDLPHYLLDNKTLIETGLAVDIKTIKL